MKNILVTGVNGFIGKNLITDLEQYSDYKVLPVSQATPIILRQQYLMEADFIVYLADDEQTPLDKAFIKKNTQFLQEFLEDLKRNTKLPPILFISSAFEEKDSLLVQSKRAAEQALNQFSEENGNVILIYRLYQIFGKWAQPGSENIVATFCDAVIHDAEITLHDSEIPLQLNYIEDVIQEIKRAVEGNPTVTENALTVPNNFQITLGNLVKRIETFKNLRKNAELPNLGEPFAKALYSTYISYLPAEQLRYELLSRDNFTGTTVDFLKSTEKGQISISVAKPGVLKGNHWHHSKVEKYLVVSGTGVIRLKNIFSHHTMEYFVSGEQFEAVDIPAGYAHQIENLGATDLVTLIWSSGAYNLEQPDSFYMEL